MRTSRQIFRTLFLIALLGGVGAVDAVGQRNLSISGTVLEVKGLCAGGEAVASVQLQFQFRNDGNSEVIILKPTQFFSRNVRFSGKSSGDEAGASTSTRILHRYLSGITRDTESHFRSVYNDEVRYLFNKMDFEFPPPTIGFIVGPGRYFEFQETIQLRSGFVATITPEPKFARDCYNRQIDIEFDHSELAIEYEFGSQLDAENQERLLSLRDKWKNSGDLLLNNQGHISYKSEKILLPERR